MITDHRFIMFHIIHIYQWSYSDSHHIISLSFRGIQKRVIQSSFISIHIMHNIWSSITMSTRIRILLSRIPPHMAHTVFIFTLCDTNDLSEYRDIFGFQIGFPYTHRMVLHHGSAVRLLFCSSSVNAMIGLDSKVHELSSRAGSLFSNFTSKNNPKIQGLRTKCVVRTLLLSSVFEPLVRLSFWGQGHSNMPPPIFLHQWLL